MQCPWCHGKNILTILVMLICHTQGAMASALTASPKARRMETGITAVRCEMAPDGSWSAWIDGNGGVLHAPPAGVTVSVPPGAVPVPTEFRLSAVEGRPSLRLSSDGSSEAVAVSRLVTLQPSGATFAKPVSIRLPHCLADGDVTILVADDGGSNVREMPLDCVTDMAETSVTFQTYHFSSFQAVTLCTAALAGLSLYGLYACGKTKLGLECVFDRTTRICRVNCRRVDYGAKLELKSGCELSEEFPMVVSKPFQRICYQILPLKSDDACEEKILPFPRGSYNEPGCIDIPDNLHDFRVVAIMMDGEQGTDAASTSHHGADGAQSPSARNQECSKEIGLFKRPLDMSQSPSCPAMQPPHQAFSGCLPHTSTTAQARPSGFCILLSSLPPSVIPSAPKPPSPDL